MPARNPQLFAKDVAGAAPDDAEHSPGIDYSVYDLIDGTVAAAGEDDLAAGGGALPCQSSGVQGGFGRQQGDLPALLAPGRGGSLQYLSLGGLAGSRVPNNRC